MFGYVPKRVGAIVQGTMLGVRRACTSLAPCPLALGDATIDGGNRDRSPSAYLASPAEERAQYDSD
jgi:neutral ceramidase